MEQPVGFVGAGTMGAPMVRRLLDSGIDVVVHDLRPAAVDPLAKGDGKPASRAETARDLAEACRVVFLSLPGPPEVEAAVAGASGLLEGARDGDVVVDLSTNSLDAVQRMRLLADGSGVAYLDAPVSGGVFAARDGTLTVMVSGPKPALERVRPALDVIAGSVFHLGEEAGAGTLVKLVNNAIFLASGLAAQEGLVMAAKAGLDVDRVLEVLNASSAAMYLGMVPLTLERRFDDAFFTLALAAKDLALAVRSADDLGVVAPVIETARDVYGRSEGAGLGDQVFFATLRMLEEAAGTEVPKPTPTDP